MFNYTKEVIINDASKIKVVNDELHIPRVANYKKELILDGKYYRTDPVTGAAGEVQITPGDFTTGDVLRLTMFLSTPNVELAEFGTPCWQDFGKPIIVEIGKPGTSETVAEKLAAAIKLAADEYVTATVDTDKTKVTIVGREKWMDFQDVILAEIQYMDADGEEKVIAEKTAKDAEIDITPAKAEFGTAEWIDHTLRFPSAPNRRYSPLFADELPVRGARYVQYVFKYIARHNVPGGLSGVDQCVDSITSHVFYVKENDVDALFKAAIDQVAAEDMINGVAETATVASMNPYSAGAQAKDVADAKNAAKDVADKLAAIAGLDKETATAKDIIEKLA